MYDKHIIADTKSEISTAIYFSKMHGIGNDFVIINCMENNFEYSLEVLSKYLCNRHYGVGADGVIFLYESETEDFKMRIFNQDGTEAEMCGNGIRCLAKYVYDKGLTEKEEFSIETLAGIKKVKLIFDNKKVVSVEVNMGIADFSNLKYLIEIENKQFYIYPISIGNPHAICFVKDVENFDVKKIGSLLENYKYFPSKTNVEFVQVIDKKNIKVRVWERGVGETNACGTGACASAMIAIQEKYTENELTVELKGGKLKIKFDKEQDEIILKGDVEFVFNGEIELM